MIRYYKALTQDGSAVGAIFQVCEGKDTIAHTFGPNATTISISKDNDIEGIIEIKKEEYENFYDIWTKQYAWRVHKPELKDDDNQEQKQGFNPKTKYILLYNGLEAICYSEQDIENLNKFLQDIRGSQFVAKNQDGSTLMLVGPEVTREATYVFKAI